MAPLILDDFQYTMPTSGAATMESTSDKTIPIAIVGMSCRFPGEASNVENLWRMCTGSQDAWTPMKEDRFNPDGYYHPDSNRAGTVSKGTMTTRLY